MRLYLLRHADAEPTPPGKSDADRKLTEKGKTQSKQAGQKLKADGIKTDIILSSPYIRAKQTAEIVAKELGQNEIIIESSLSCGCTPENIKEILKNYSDKKSILCVSHEPDLGIIAADLSGLDEVQPFEKAEAREFNL